MTGSALLVKNKLAVTGIRTRDLQIYLLIPMSISEIITG